MKKWSPSKPMAVFSEVTQQTLSYQEIKEQYILPKKDNMYTLDYIAMFVTATTIAEYRRERNAAEIQSTSPEQHELFEEFRRIDRGISSVSRIETLRDMTSKNYVLTPELALPGTATLCTKPDSQKILKKKPWDHFVMNKR